MGYWSVGPSLDQSPDVGDAERTTVHDCWAVDVLFERCHATACGRCPGIVPAELYLSGFNLRSANLIDCEAERCRKAGFLCKNQEAGGLVLENHRDTGSAYSLTIEYGGERAMIESFVSDGATRRALQMVGNNADMEVEIRNYAGDGRPVLLGITELPEFVDASGHMADLARYRVRGTR